MFFFSDQNSDVKLGNPLLVLLQSPFQLLSYLLFDRQVSPERYGTACKPHRCKKDLNRFTRLLSFLLQIVVADAAGATSSECPGGDHSAML